jgi:hypothetical protein
LRDRMRALQRMPHAASQCAPRWYSKGILRGTPRVLPRHSRVRPSMRGGTGPVGERGVDAVPRAEQLHVQDRRVVSVEVERPRVSHCAQMSRCRYVAKPPG